MADTAAIRRQICIQLFSPFGQMDLPMHFSEIGGVLVVVKLIWLGGRYDGQVVVKGVAHGELDPQRGNL
jgi:hypothetical protein